MRRNNNNNLTDDLKDINKNDLDQIMAFSNEPQSSGYGMETVHYNKESLVNIVNSELAKIRANTKAVEDKVNSGFAWYHDVIEKNDRNTFLANMKWEKIRETIERMNAEKDKSNSQIHNSELSKINEVIHTNKPTILSNSNVKIESPLTANTPFGDAGDITINELWNKGIDVFDTTLVQMIKDNVNVVLVGSSITSMIMYRSIVKLYMKSAFNNKLPDALISAPSTRSKEIALFMIMGAPFIAGALITINKLTAGGTKVLVNITESNNLEGTGSNSASSSSSLFLFLNKLPGWMKVILRYLAICLILTFITSVIGYKSNVIAEIYSQFYIYLGYFLKLYCVLNFLVIIYFIWKLYIIVMFAQNKDYINPEHYPTFIKNEILESKDIGVNLYSKDPGTVYKHYLRLIFLYTSIVIFGLTMMILSSIY